MGLFGLLVDAAVRGAAGELQACSVCVAGCVGCCRRAGCWVVLGVLGRQSVLQLVGWRLGCARMGGLPHPERYPHDEGGCTTSTCAHSSRPLHTVLCAERDAGHATAADAAPLRARSSARGAQADQSCPSPRHAQSVTSSTLPRLTRLLEQPGATEVVRNMASQLTRRMAARAIKLAFGSQVRRASWPRSPSESCGARGEGRGMVKRVGKGHVDEVQPTLLPGILCCTGPAHPGGAPSARCSMPLRRFHGRSRSCSARPPQHGLLPCAGAPGEKHNKRGSGGRPRDISPVIPGSERRAAAVT